MKQRINNNKIPNSRHATHSCICVCIVIKYSRWTRGSGWYAQRRRYSLTFTEVWLLSMWLIGTGIWIGSFSTWGRRMCHGRIFTGRYGEGCNHLTARCVIYNLLGQIWDIAATIRRTQSFNTHLMLDCKRNILLILFLNYSFPCCNQKTLRFDTAIKRQGCKASNHIIN